MMRYIRDKRVLFITTKNPDYIRNSQEIRLITEHARSFRVIASDARHYPVRLFLVWVRLLITRVSHFDTVFAGFAPQLVLPFFRFKFKNADVVADFFISMYDTFCCDRKKISPAGPAGRFLHFLDELTLRRADMVVCDTGIHGQYFVSEFHVVPEKLFLLYIQADAAVYRPRPGQRPAWLRDKKIVLYFGSMLPLQGADIVLEAMNRLRDCKDLYFYCIGPIGRKYGKPVSGNIEYIDWLSQEELAAHIAQADLCLAGHFSASIEKAGRTIPGKAVIYKAMNKPMILGDSPANHELYHDDAGATFVERGNARALAERILLALHINVP